MIDDMKNYVFNIYIGREVFNSIDKLKLYGKKSIDLLLRLEEADIKYPVLPEDRHPRDSVDDIEHALYIIGREHTEYILDLFHYYIDSDHTCLPKLASLVGELKLEKAIDDLIKGLKHENWYVRQNCCSSLLKFKGEKINQALLEAVKDEDEYIRSLALNELEKRGMLLEGLKRSSIPWFWRTMRIMLFLTQRMVNTVRKTFS